MTAPPIACTWDGEAFRPLPRLARLADQHFVIGETYPLVVQEQRSQATHAHYFACIHAAWDNLPEDDQRFPTPEHLRKWALIRAGYSDERSIVCASKAEALRVAAFVRPIDEYAVVVARDCVVKVFTAQSQSLRAMGRADFAKSKQAVLDVLAGLIGADPAALGRSAA